MEYSSLKRKPIKAGYLAMRNPNTGLKSLYKKKYKFYNPIIQNWSHINFLKNISADFKHLNYFSIIVFVGSAKLKKINASVPVIYKRQAFENDPAEIMKIHSNNQSTGKNS
jgi:hypothetical protein